MIGVPLRDVLDLDPLRDATVVAGAAGLDRRVRHVNVMEVPDILRWVNADELLLTTAYPLRDDRPALLGLIPGLAARGLAGLALKPARYIDEIPAEMLASANELGFPLIELPQDSSFSDIINSVLTVILNAQAVRLERTAEIHDRFTSIVLGGGGLPQIAQALADSIGRPIAIVDGQRHVQTVTRGAEAVLRRGATLSLDDALDASDPGRRAVVMLDGRPVTVQPIRVGSEQFGSIVAVGAAELVDDQIDAIEYAATIAALRQVQARAVAEADRRFESVCLEELVTGHMDRAVLLERAAAFSWDLALPRAAVIARPESHAGRPWAELAGSAQEAGVRRRLADVARSALGRGAITWERSSEVASLVPATGPGDGGVPQAARRLLAEWEHIAPDTIISIGVGRSSDDPIRLSDSYAEARRALHVGVWRTGGGAVSEFRHLGVDRLLVGLPDAELGDFVTTMLGPLIDYDRTHRADLVVTLEAWVETRNAAAAARRLFVHYNTMKNRLRLIEDILGASLDDPHRALALSVALRIHGLPRA